MNRKRRDDFTVALWKVFGAVAWLDDGFNHYWRKIPRIVRAMIMSTLTACLALAIVWLLLPFLTR